MDPAVLQVPGGDVAVQAGWRRRGGKRRRCPGGFVLVAVLFTEEAIAAVVVVVAPVAVLLRDGLHRAIELIHAPGVGLERLAGGVDGFYILAAGVVVGAARLAGGRADRGGVVGGVCVMVLYGCVFKAEC